MTRFSKFLHSIQTYNKKNSKKKRKNKTTNPLSRTKAHLMKNLKKYPFIVLSTLLAITFSLIAIGYIIRQNKEEQKQSEPEPLKVETYSIGTSPTIKAFAKIDKENVVTIVAQKAGIVQKIYVKEGEHVEYRGKTLVYISDNYQGANAAAINKQIVKKQYDNIKETFETQKDILNKQRELAKKQDANNDELREITEQSIVDTKNVIEFSEETLDWVNESLETLEQATSSGQNASSISSLKGFKLQLLNGLSQTRNALRQSEYQAEGDNPPAEMSDLQRDVALKQLDIQEKSLQLNKEVTELQYRLAQVQESLSYPSTMSNGDIERIHVRIGDAVQPGTPLITMKGCNDLITATVKTSKNIASQTSLYNAATFYFPNKTVQLTPQFISSEPVYDGRYAIKFAIPETYDASLGINELIEIELPVGIPNTGSTIPFIPLDSVYQSSQGSFVYLEKDGKATVQNVELGEIMGQFIAVKEGLQQNDTVILNRNVIDGMHIQTQ